MQRQAHITQQFGLP